MRRSELLRMKKEEQKICFLQLGLLLVPPRLSLLLDVRKLKVRFPTRPIRTQYHHWLALTGVEFVSECLHCSDTMSRRCLPPPCTFWPRASEYREEFDNAQRLDVFVAKYFQIITAFLKFPNEKRF